MERQGTYEGMVEQRDEQQEHPISMFRLVCATIINGL